jgi:hypothetical protein
LRKIAILLGSAALLLAANADLILHNGKIVTVDSRFTTECSRPVLAWHIVCPPALWSGRVMAPM